MISSPWAYFFETLITLSESGLHKAEPNPNYWADGKESTCQCRRLGFDPQGRSPGGGNDNPLQYSCLDNPKDRGAWQAIQYMGHKESDMTERLSTALAINRFSDLFLLLLFLDPN